MSAIIPTSAREAERIPVTPEDGLALTILYALTRFDGTRDTFKFRTPITQYQIDVAQEVLELFKLQYSEEDILGFCRYLSYKSHHVSSWIKLVSALGGRHSTRDSGECIFCNQNAKICQIPKRHADKHGWFNDINLAKIKVIRHGREERGEDQGLCIAIYLDWLMDMGILQFKPPTGWEAIDAYYRFREKYPTGGHDGP